MQNNSKKKNGKKRLDADATMDNLSLEQNTYDLISHLPELILSRILTRLSFRAAVKTSFLSTRWRDTWKLTYLSGRGSTDDAIACLSTFLTEFDEIHKGKGNWGIQFDFVEGNILLATVSPGKAVHLDFSKGNHGSPSEFGWFLELNQPSCFNFSVIERLYLVSVNQRTTAIVNQLVSHMPGLRCLSLVRCKGIRSLRILGSSKIRRVTILDCLQLKSLRIETPFLRVFYYRGKLPWMWPLYHHHLLNAMFDFRHGPGYDIIKDKDLHPFQFLISNCETLTLCRWFFDAMVGSVPTWDDTCFFLEELWWIDYSCKGNDSNSLLTYITSCPSLERLFVTIDPESYRSPGGAAFPNSIIRETKLKLKLVKLDGFADPKCEILFAMQLLEICSPEPTIIASSSHKDFVRRLVKKSDFVEGHPDDAYMFVEEPKQGVMFSRDHAHMRVA